MERELCEAAMEGSVTFLLNLLGRDPLILDRYITAYFAETPLHIAAMLGHLEFATELLKRKPELACELNLRKSTPLHLASAKGDVEMVKLLLCANPQMCYARDGCGWNPLHVAVMKGQVDTLRELVRVRSEAACVPIDGANRETILHVCVKHNQLEALKLLLAEILVCNNTEFINSKDGDGNTILHLAVLDRQFQTIDFLTKIAGIDVNAKNIFGLTALDLLEIRLKEASGDCLNIGRLLQQAGAMNSRSNVSSETTGAAANVTTTIVGGSTQREILKEILLEFLSKQEEWHKQNERNGRLESHRNAIMIAASVFAAAAFQAPANPPGGFWQDTVSSSAPNGPHDAGAPILSDLNPGRYMLFSFANLTAFFISSCVFLLLLSGLPLKNEVCTGILMMAVWIAIAAVGLSFIVSTSFFGFYFILMIYISIFVSKNAPSIRTVIVALAQDFIFAAGFQTKIIQEMKYISLYSTNKSEERRHLCYVLTCYMLYQKLFPFA
ncbi:hypothetical protein Nepgr_009173 [Nepenthes gracilis]|uniref:PGG domain-containing protein n=1 Tax=Nepenthes gracilis TaxID=150966 RepID=A0AAD3XJX0_NEPGR|nr:hypothetical protein Nepgr_009173 [Nepenthes gracilis]